MKDFIAYILYLFGGKGHPACSDNSSSSSAEQPFSDMVSVGSDLVDYSRRNPFIPITEENSLGHALKV